MKTFILVISAGLVFSVQAHADESSFWFVDQPNANIRMEQRGQSFLIDGVNYAPPSGQGSTRTSRLLLDLRNSTQRRCAAMIKTMAEVLPMTGNSHTSFDLSAENAEVLMDAEKKITVTISGHVGCKIETARPAGREFVSEELNSLKIEPSFPQARALSGLLWNDFAPGARGWRSAEIQLPAREMRKAHACRLLTDLAIRYASSSNTRILNYAQYFSNRGETNVVGNTIVFDLTQSDPEQIGCLVGIYNPY